MNENTLIDITDLTWDDVQAHGTGHELGIVLIVLSRDGDEATTQIAGTMPPEVVRFVLTKAAAARLADYSIHSRELRKAV